MLFRSHRYNPSFTNLFTAIYRNPVLFVANNRPIFMCRDNIDYNHCLIIESTRFAGLDLKIHYGSMSPDGICNGYMIFMRLQTFLPNQHDFFRREPVFEYHLHRYQNDEEIDLTDNNYVQTHLTIEECHRLGIPPKQDQTPCNYHGLRIPVLINGEQKLMPHGVGIISFDGSDIVVVHDRGQILFRVPGASFEPQQLMIANP